MSDDLDALLQQVQLEDASRKNGPPPTQLFGGGTAGGFGASNASSPATSTQTFGMGATAMGPGVGASSGGMMMGPGAGANNMMGPGSMMMGPGAGAGAAMGGMMMGPGMSAGPGAGMMGPGAPMNPSGGMMGPGGGMMMGPGAGMMTGPGAMMSPSGGMMMGPGAMMSPSGGMMMGPGMMGPGGMTPGAGMGPGGGMMMMSPGGPMMGPGGGMMMGPGMMGPGGMMMGPGAPGGGMMMGPGGPMMMGPNGMVMTMAPNGMMMAGVPGGVPDGAPAGPAVACTRCKQNIIGKISSANGKPYHPECFYCAHCQMPFDEGAPFVEYKEQLYCDKDYKELYAPKCANCKGVITAKCVTALDKYFHPEHFVCPGCGLSLQGKTFLEFEGMPFCPSCKKTRDLARQKQESVICAKCKIVSRISVEWPPFLS